MNQSPSRSVLGQGCAAQRRVAADLHISKSSVRRCAKKAKADTWCDPRAALARVTLTERLAFYNRSGRWVDRLPLKRCPQKMSTSLTQIQVKRGNERTAALRTVRSKAFTVRGSHQN